MNPAAGHAVIVLAAGSSRRLGRDKAALQRADGHSFLEHVIDAALSTAPLLVRVVRRPEHTWPVHAALSAAALRVDCLDADEGMAASLRCGLRDLPAGAEGALVLLLDQPALAAAHLQRLVAVWQARRDAAVASVYAGVRGAPAILPRAGFADVAMLRGDVGARHWLRRQRDVIELAAPALAADVDGPGDWVG